MKKVLLQIACALLWAIPLLAHATLTGTFTITPTTGNAPLSATLNWNVTGGDTTTVCTASGAWGGTKSLTGTQVTSTLLNDASYTLTCVTPAMASTPPETGSATVSWTAPTKNSDGTALTDLTGFRVIYGQTATTLSQTITISNPATSSYVVANLSSGVWYFAVRAFNANGVESVNSNVASKNFGTLSSGTPGIPAQQWAKTVSIDVNTQPQAPVITVAALEVYKPNVGYKGQLKVDKIGQFTTLGQVCVPGQDMNGLNVVKITTPTPLIKLDAGRVWPMQVLAVCKASM